MGWLLHESMETEPTGGELMEVAAGPLCGFPEELELKMDELKTRTTAIIFQDPQSGDVSYGIWASHETESYFLPGYGRQKAYHNLVLTPSIEIGERHVTGDILRFWKPGCYPGAYVPVGGLTWR